MTLNLISRISRLAAFGIAVVSMISAQNFVGGVRGLVLDPGGAAIANATVTLTNQATRVASTAATNATGQYSFSQVDPGTYSITVEAQGFKKLTRPDVVVGTQETVGVDLTMEIGQMTESVEVTSEVPLVETTNASNGQVINDQQVTDLPNLDRNVYLLSKLTSNVVYAGDPRDIRFQDQSASSQIAIGGGPIRGNNYLSTAFRSRIRPTGRCSFRATKACRK
jgi:trimeric autotransporter adhesin